jgi:hypothetical protein
VHFWRKNPYIVASPYYVNRGLQMSDLQTWIRDELTIDVESELSKYKEKVKHFLRLTPSGEVMIVRGDLTAKQKILLYSIGKVYSKIAQFCSEASVSNKELSEALNLPEGTVKTSLFALRKEGFLIPQEPGIHQMKMAMMGIAFEKYLEEKTE